MQVRVARQRSTSASLILASTASAMIWSATSNANVTTVFTAVSANTTLTNATQILAETEELARIFR